MNLSTVLTTYSPTLVIKSWFLTSCLLGITPTIKQSTKLNIKQIELYIFYNAVNYLKIDTMKGMYKDIDGYTTSKVWQKQYEYL